MQEVDRNLFPSSSDIWYAGQLKAFAARLPAVATRYDLSPVTVLKVQCVALEFMEMLIHRMSYAAEYLRHRQQAAVASLQMQPELAANWHAYKGLLHEFVQELVSHLQQHAAYTAADERTLGLAALAHPPAPSCPSPHGAPPRDLAT
jgi:hypothetical protein